MSLEEIGSFETSFYDEEAREEYSKEKNSLEGLSEDENFQASCGMEGFCDRYGNVEVIVINRKENWLKYRHIYVH